MGGFQGGSSGGRGDFQVYSFSLDLYINFKWLHSTSISLLSLPLDDTIQSSSLIMMLKFSSFLTLALVLFSVDVVTATSVPTGREVIVGGFSGPATVYDVPQGGMQ